MIIRSKAPLRLGLAGGGTDLEPYSNLFGGLVLNATISLYAHCTLEITNNGFIQFHAADLGINEKFESQNFLELNNKLDLHKAVYNRIVREFNNDKPLSLKLTTHCDSPPGSGLGSSSTMVVSILKAFVELLSLPLGEYDIAYLAYEIERKDIGLSGGKQDQYAAAFGGFNFMEFSEKDKVIVNPLRIKNWIKNELEASIILFYTGVSRSSAEIINDQIKNTEDSKKNALEAMHSVKKSAINMKEAVLKGDMTSFGKILENSWEFKKKMSNKISNSHIQEIFTTAKENGAISGKVSGAGGGGFIMFFVDPINKVKVVNSLNKFNGFIVNFNFSSGGCHGWKIS
ncbi:MAG: GHMP kinase [Flavobacteriaceae bacterium]|nr:GHMP kinase [Flavobacteriaceae bacterium]